MARKFFQTEEFRKLSTEWEQKLAQEGLPDIETQVGGEKKLKRYAIEISRKRNHPAQVQARIRYFQLLQAEVCQAQFDCEVDELVMRLKAEGAQIKEICDELLAKGMSRYRRTVRLIIRKYEQRWGVRSWNPDQLKYNWAKRKKPPTQ